jgi:hypothetical protein
MPPRVPSPFKPARPALVEPIQQPLYASQEISTTPQSQVLFFQSTSGSAGSNSVFTNMEIAGQLPNPKIFVVRGFRLHVQQNVAVLGAAANSANAFVDLLRIAESYWYRFFVGVKEYLKVPAFYLASGLGAWLSVAGATGTAGTNDYFHTSQLGQPLHENYYKINRRPIVIPPQQNFQGELNLGPALASISAARRVWNFLEGDLGREVM